AKRLVLHVLDKGSTVALPDARLGARAVRLTFHLSATRDRRLVLAEEVFVGWRPVPRAARPVHLRLTFTRLLTRRSMDPTCASCPNPESRLDQQIVKPPGEWLVFSDVDGLWRLWPRVFPAADGRTFRLSLSQD